MGGHFIFVIIPEEDALDKKKFIPLRIEKKKKNKQKGVRSFDATRFRSFVRSEIPTRYLIIGLLNHSII